jgi:hypothetical protein
VRGKTTVEEAEPAVTEQKQHQQEHYELYQLPVPPELEQLPKPGAELSRAQQLLAYKQQKAQAKEGSEIATTDKGFVAKGSRGVAIKAAAGKAQLSTSAKRISTKAPVPTQAKPPQPAEEGKDEVVRRSVVAITYNKNLS